MELDSAVLTALIGVGSGVLSAAVTARLTRDATQAQAARADSKNAAYLASQVAPELRRYAEACLDVSYDDGYDQGEPAGGNGCSQVTVFPPTFVPAAFVVEWKALTGALMVEVLTLPEHVHSVTRKLSDDSYDDPPDYPDLFHDRQRIYADLGLHVLKLADRLDAYAKLPKNNHGTELTKTLVNRKIVLDIEHAAWEKRSLEALECMEAVAPPKLSVPSG